MIVNRATIRRQLNGEEIGSPLTAMEDGARNRVLDDLDAAEDATPAGVGLPSAETRKLQGRASPLSQQARTGRSSLLGDR